MSQFPPVTGLLESSLYVDDMERAVAFYETLFGFSILFRDERLCAMDVGRQGVLLLFRRGASREPILVPGGRISPHDGEGPLHFALAIPTDSLPAWRERLAALQISIESEMHWPRGGVSLYFRDPDGHLAELATPGVWSTY